MRAFRDSGSPEWTKSTAARLRFECCGEKEELFYLKVQGFLTTVYTSNSYEAGLQLKYCKVPVFMFGCLVFCFFFDVFSTFSFLFFLLFLGIRIFHYTVLNFKKQ